MGIAVFVGYKLKPQTVVIMIAIVLVECFCNTVVNRQRVKTALKSVAAFAAAFAVCMGLYQAVVVPGVHMELDKEADLPMTHFFMMGLNESTNGVYSGDDVGFSFSYLTRSERAEANMQEAVRRINELGVAGMLRHIEKKSLVNFADGTFAWSEEGGFYNTMIVDKNDSISPFLKNLIYEDGKYYAVFVNFMQMIWIVTLFGMLGIFFEGKRGGEVNKELLVMVISVIGLILFVTLFEARARYLYTYTPVFIILAMTGFRNMEKKIC
jgi:hypothetical protein